MLSPSPHIESLDAKDAGVASILDGVIKVAEGMKTEFVRCASEKHHYQLELASTQTPNSNIVAEGKQKELIAILNGIYEMGLVSDCTKAEYFKRMAQAYGAPALENYSASLNNVMNTAKYPEIFNNLKDAALKQNR